MSCEEAGNLIIIYGMALPLSVLMWICVAALGVLVYRMMRSLND